MLTPIRLDSVPDTFDSHNETFRVRPVRVDWLAPEMSPPDFTAWAGRGRIAGIYRGEDPLLVQQSRPNARNAEITRQAMGIKLMAGNVFIGLFLVDRNFRQRSEK